MEKLRKIFALIALFAIIIGAIGGFGYSAFQGQGIIAFCIVVLAAAAAPTVTRLYKFLTD